MTEDTGVHPGSWVGDSVEEFKKLPTWGKVGVGILFVGVAYLGYKAYSNRGSSGTALTMQGNLQPTNNQPGGSSPFPQVQSGDSSVPLLPSNVNPLFNSSGGLVGYQSGYTPSSTPPDQVGATPNSPSLVETIRNRFTGNTSDYDKAHPEGVPVRSSPSSGNNVIGSLGYGASVNATNPTQGGGNFSPTQGDTQWYQIQYQGKTGYVSGHDIQFSPQVQPSSTAKGGGSMSWQSRVFRLTHYTPQLGDNMNEVSRKLGYGNWRELGQEQFIHGERFKLP